MSKSRRNKNKHAAGKQAGVPAAERPLDTGDIHADTDGSGSTASTAADGAVIFSQSEASAADAQVLAAAMAESESEVIGDAAAVESAVEDTAESASSIAADAPIADAVPVTVGDVADTEPVAEPTDRAGRRAKRADKHATTPAPAADAIALVVPAEPRRPAMEQLAEYERLSLAHVAGTPQQSDAPGHWRGIGFRLGTRRLAAAFDEVVEILSMPQVTHVPGAQPWMLGVANVRGTLLPVVDLKQFLEGERTVIHEAQRILVVRQSGGNVAVLIDELFGQRSFNDAQIVSVADETGRYGYFVKQMYRVDDFDWGVFSMSTLTRTPEFRQAAA